MDDVLELALGLFNGMSIIYILHFVCDDFYIECDIL